MKSDDDSRTAGLMDAVVSANYQACRLETTPVALDREVIQAASKALKSNNGPAWFLPWLRPATFVATLGMSIALLLELSEFQDQATLSSHDSLGIPGEVGATVQPVERRDVVMPGRTIPSSALPQTDTVPQATPASTAGSFRDAADAAARQVRELDATADANLQQMPPSQTVPAATSDGTSAVIDQPECTDEQRAHAEDWWLCVEELMRAGMTEQADTERRALQIRFPEFQPP